MAATGLAANPKDYRARLDEQTDDQIDAWAAELMRDIAIRRGVAGVIADFLRAAGDRRAWLRAGLRRRGGPPAVIGRDREGRLLVPAITLHALVPGIRSETPDGRRRLIDYLVANFEDLVYV